jgi:undecaprenyl-diphosphatase
MSELEALLLGIVQGLTEFLPISSSGHLILVPWLQDYRFLLEHPGFNKTFDVALHAGTLIAVVAYFRVELRAMAVGFARTIRARRVGQHVDERLAWVVIVATIPAVIVGAVGEDWIDENLGEPWMISVLLIGFGLLLFHADRHPGTHGIEEVGMRHGVLIGLAQSLALSPGVSRSGITMTAGRYLGLSRETAARVSFLLLVPVTAGAVVYKGIEAASEGLPEGVVGPMIVGTIASALSGYAAIAGLLRLVRTHSYSPFVVYRVGAGLFVLLLIATGLRSGTF